MTELGLRLKEAREEQGMTLEDLQGTTKIQKRYLVAIEEGNYDVIPGKFYVRAFIKQYSETVGLDSDLLFDEYKKDVPSTQTDEVSEKISQMPAKKELPKSASKLMGALPTILVILGVIVVAAICYILIQGGNQSQSPPNKTSTNTEKSEYAVSDDSPLTDADKKQKDSETQSEKTTSQESNDSAASTTENKKPELNISAVGSEGTTTTYEVTGAESLKLEVIAKESSWVRVRDESGKELQAGELSKGKTFSHDISDQTEVDLRLGYTPGIELKVNGKTVSYKLNPNEAITQNIKIINKKEEKSS
ncbi:helix-turn-helix domain-containing protein [Bacillus gobiensis]|uniref:helix-turn-helix domain-containing protein n=1 Tax=Bacillus gobiensis TaxID=1441095 RepID=UPI003D242D7B